MTKDTRKALDIALKIVRNADYALDDYCEDYEITRSEFWDAFKELGAPERTCRILIRENQTGGIPVCVCLECGGVFYAKANGDKPNYCIDCGAKVVKQ